MCLLVMKHSLFEIPFVLYQKINIGHLYKKALKIILEAHVVKNRKYLYPMSSISTFYFLICKNFKSDLLIKYMLHLFNMSTSKSRL